VLRFWLRTGCAGEHQVREYDLPNGFMSSCIRQSVPDRRGRYGVHRIKKRSPTGPGFAHFFEHLMSKGSGTFTRQFFRLIQNAGGELMLHELRQDVTTSLSPRNQIELAITWSRTDAKLRGLGSKRSVGVARRKETVAGTPVRFPSRSRRSHAYRVTPYVVPSGRRSTSRARTTSSPVSTKILFHKLPCPGRDIEIAEDEGLWQKLRDIPRGTGEVTGRRSQKPQTAESVTPSTTTCNFPQRSEAYHMPGQGTKDIRAQHVTTLLSGARARG